MIPAFILVPLLDKVLDSQGQVLHTLVLVDIRIQKELDTLKEQSLPLVALDKGLEVLQNEEHKKVMDHILKALKGRSRKALKDRNLKELMEEDHTLQEREDSRTLWALEEMERILHMKEEQD